MCGGVGSRFWPFSRESRPKQFLDFFGTGRSLLQLTADRVREIVPPERIVLVTNAAYADIVREQLPDVPAHNILCEPARRNTAPCILWAARHIHALDPEASMAVLPADHLILREEEFRKDLREGFEFVEHGDRLLTMGIQPSYPATGYGYIQCGALLEDWPGICKVKTFAEKPDRRMAEVFLSTGEFLWNAGIFLWSAESILKAYDDLAPDMAQLFAGCTTYGAEGESAEMERIFPAAESISVDYCIMEKASNVYVKGVDIGWSDLGSWKALHDVSPKTSEGNVTQGCRVLARDCRGTIFATEGEKVIVASGLEDYIVADTPNALMICPIDKEQDIKGVVNEVRNLCGPEYV